MVESAFLGSPQLNIDFQLPASQRTPPLRPWPKSPVGFIVQSLDVRTYRRPLVAYYRIFPVSFTKTRAEDLIAMKAPTSTFKTGKGKWQLAAKVMRIGQDLMVWIGGGERPHIGAVAMALSRPSLRDPQRQSSTASVFTYPGHKEDIIVKEASERLASALGGHVVVCAGAHWENLDPEGIQMVLENASRLVSKIIKALGPSPTCRESPSG